MLRRLLPGLLCPSSRPILAVVSGVAWRRRSVSAMASDWEEMGEFMEYMERLKNYEKLGVPKGAGTESEDGFDLGRMGRLLHRLGNPHTHFRAVHIAGTKGKGSSAAYISKILREQGYNVGCYSSPHLLTIRERISLGSTGETVSSEKLINLFRQTKKVLDHAIDLENGALSHFEVFTALAFFLFSQEKVDIAIIEAGLGGARDATNVIRSSELALSVITSVGKEHLDALGGSLESIATAKSGVIKQGRPVVIGGPFETHIEHIIHERAVLLNSPVISICDPGITSTLNDIGYENGKPYQVCDIFVHGQGDMLSSIEMHDLKLQMLGKHQLLNSIVATCTALCLRNQGWNILDSSIRSGLEKTWLPGRSQFLTAEETSKFGLSDMTLLLDGAHTEGSACALLDVIKAVQYGPLAFVIAMANDKDHLAFSSQLLSGRRPDAVILTEVPIAGGRSRAVPADELKDIWIKVAKDQSIDHVDLGIISCNNNPADDLAGLSGSNARTLIGIRNGEIHDAVKLAAQFIEKKTTAAGSGLICLTGSLHIVASALSAMNP